MAVDLTIPEIGESVTEAFVGKWLKKAGDHVEKDEIVAELESEKANFELPAPVTGTIDEILVEAGDSAEVGDVIARMTEGPAKDNGDLDNEDESRREPSDDEKQDKAESDDETDDDSSAKSASARKEADKSAKKGDGKPSSKKTERKDKDSDDAPSQANGERGKASTKPRIMPAAQRALSEYGLSPDDVEATGPGGRLLKEDVMRHVAEARKEPDDEAADEKTSDTTAQPADVSGREDQVVPMSPMRQTIARHLVEAQRNAALLTTFNEIDMSAVIELRKTHRDRFAVLHGVKLGFMSFFVKACVDALKQYPAINASVRDEKKIAYHNYYDIGIAVSTERGLVVPVVRDADQLSFADIEAAIADFAQRASEHRLEIDELRGGTFTITNGGVFGSLLSTPIVNPPQSGVLGMHTIQDRPVAREGQVVIRPMMYVALTYDHRIVDGREAVSFLNRIRQAIEQPARMLIEV